MMNRQEEWQLPLHKGFALLEPSNRPYFIDEKCLVGKPCIPFGMEKIEHLMPQLIDLPKISDSDGELLQELCADELNHARPPYVCAWIGSELNGDDLAALVASRLLGKVGSRRLIWRFYDPRVMSLANSVLTAEQSDALFHRIESWVLPWSGHWWDIDRNQDRASSFGHPDDSWPTPAQWMIFASSEYIHRVHTEICARKIVEPKDPPAIQQAILRGMREAATKLKLLEPVQQVEYARLQVLFGDSFMYHRVLGGLRDKLAQGHMKWSEFRALVDEDELERLSPEPQFHF